MTDEELTDEELVKALRDTYDLVKMWPEKQPDGFTNLLVLRNLVPDTADRIEDLTEQLEAARADAKEAEAYAEELAKENERLRRTIGAAGKLGRIIGFLGDDEGRIAAFLEACGPELINSAIALLTEIEGEKT